MTAVEHGILFRASMVLAILNDLKTQTRRPVKIRRPTGSVKPVELVETTATGAKFLLADGREVVQRWPYGPVGSRLWVRESGWMYGRWAKNGVSQSGRQRWRFKPVGQRWVYSRDEAEPITCWGNDFDGFTARPGIHMPRWSARIILQITDLRVEQLMAISEHDARQEGAPAMFPAGMGPKNHRTGFADMWHTNHQPAFDWNDNPFVWVVGFAVLQKKRVAA